MYNGEADIVSLHMFDGDTGEYNLPYIKKILVGYPYILLNLLSRKAGLYVKKGNPFNLASWTDLTHDKLTFINRERGLAQESSLMSSYGSTRFLLKALKAMKTRKPTI